MALSAFLAILFTQSGWDKISHRNDNPEWLQGHFAKTPLKLTVPWLMTVLTFLEMLTGVMCFVGLCAIVIWGQPVLSTMGFMVAGLTILYLFLGQRSARYYDGAASLTGYFVIVLIGLHCITF